MRCPRKFPRTVIMQHDASLRSSWRRPRRTALQFIALQFNAPQYVAPQIASYGACKNLSPSIPSLRRGFLTSWPLCVSHNYRTFDPSPHRLAFELSCKYRVSLKATANLIINGATKMHEDNGKAPCIHIPLRHPQEFSWLVLICIGFAAP